MSSSDIALIVRWLVPLWLLGWAVFPVSRRLFSFLPDQGLAVGRVLAILLGSLGAFWLASLHLLPLSVGTLLIPVIAVVGMRQWINGEARAALQKAKTEFIVSDCVFVLAFLFFVWVRLRHPSINDLEKPMDLAMLSQSAKTSMLPFEHFWFAGVDFTNYYFFGPFVGGLLARLFATSAPYAYNLAQPLFCALFLSVLWSLGAALSRSKWLGLGVMALVGLGGHLEPLRQLSKGVPLSEINWWDTTRVIPSINQYPPQPPHDSFTITEYPAFTMLIGDAHAHFYALALAITHFCVCLGIVCVQSERPKAALIVLGGVLIGIIALTNTWDIPLYGLLWGLCVFYVLHKDAKSKFIKNATFVGLGLAVLTALPFFVRFRSQIGGGGFELWIPHRFSFALFWGVWIALGIIAFGFELGKIVPSREGDYRKILLGLGVIALLFPSIYFLGGVFAGGDSRHQDTVFKFYLQAWLLAGTAIGSEFLLRLRVWSRSASKAFTVPTGVALLILVWVLSLAPYATWKTRTQGYGEDGLSLDGGKWLSQSDHKAIEWLRDQNGVVLEKLGENSGGDYDANMGALATQSGLPSFLCWPQHVRGWGFQNDATREALRQLPSGGNAQEAQAGVVNAQIDGRARDLNAIFDGDAATRRALVQKNGISFIVIRPNQPALNDPHFESHEFNGDDGSKTIILERKGF
ncbi:hypothetical protein IAD21_03314 [Abditibacteriota bacterium]|nr:hypothetical protein IAD21_03314 [Abditibacteriota bacterium]